MKPAILCILALLVVSSADGAIPVQVRAVPDAQHCFREGWIAAQPAGGGDLVRLPLKQDQTSYLLSLPSSDRLWQVTIEAEGCWSETAVWEAAVSPELVLGLHPAGVVESVFETQARSLPAVSAVVHAVQNGQAARDGSPAACRIEFPRWQCVVPANLEFDLRLDASGFGAVHYGSVSVRPGEKRELEPQQLLAGASIAGWVQDDRGAALPGAQLTLYPMEVQDGRRDQQRLAARRRMAKANGRGFFQFAGLDPGSYRIVSEAKGLSPATVESVRVREGETLIWPRVIAHAPVAALEVSFSPPTSRDGAPWTVELSELSPLHLERRPPLQRKATADGLWRAEGLRADTYRIIVRSGDGSTLEDTAVDLSEGGLKTVSLNVRSLAVRGVLLLGDEPLAADLAFTNRSGKIVRATAGDDGAFEALFPTDGKWVPAVRYPAGGRGSTVTLEEVEVAPREDGPMRLELHVPGGRVRGEVVGPEGTPQRAAVHVIRGQRPVAQVTTGDDGKFDFIGIPPGAYTIDAESRDASTPEPVRIDVPEDDVKEVRLTLAPIQWLTGTVFTPHGGPASGAVVHVLRDDATWWSRVVTDITGRFEYRLPGGTADVDLVIVTYGFPSAMVRVPAPDRRGITVVLQADGGILRVANAPRAHVRTRNIAAPLRAFYFPEPLGRFAGGVHLPPGTYMVCPSRTDGRCRSVTIVPGAEARVEFENAGEEENASP